MVLYNGMASTSPLAALYFVALMTFGNYVLFNLLVAILVEGFQAEVRSFPEEFWWNCLDFLGSNLEPKICTLTPNGHLDLAPMPNALGVYPAERLSFALGSRKSSESSVGRAGLEQRPLCPGGGSLYTWTRPVPQGSSWSRRSSWNSVGRASRSVGVGTGGSLRVRGPHSYRVEHESLLLSPPPLFSRHFVPRRDRRALSLELPELLQVPRAPPTSRHSHQHKKSFSGRTAGAQEHQDCNGKTPAAQQQILSEVYPQVNTRKERDDLEDEIDYSLCFRVQRMVEVYRPDWCETREDWSVFLFSPQNKFRVMCQSIIAHKLFDYVVLAFIFSNCITVALERPKILQGSLVVSMGLYLGDQAYLRSSWNILDGFLVFVSLIDIVVSMAGGAKILGVLRVLRLLRTLRPLRVISRAPGLKLVVETLITSLKPIGNIVLICCAFFIIFGILGVQLFKGKFFHCLGLDVRNITNKSDCLLANYKWVHHKYNFDNLGQVTSSYTHITSEALMSLFVLASKDGWVNIMYHGLDAVGVDQQPVTNNNPWMLLYFISFLLIVSFFVLNMFVGVVVENFHKCRQHQEVEEAKRREEKRLRRMEKKRRKAQKLPYFASYSHVRLMIHNLCTNHYLDLFITFIICVNVVTMSLEHYSQPHVMCNEDYPCEGMSRHATFENFGMAFLTLFQVSTGDNWNGIMKDTLRECPQGEYNCNPSLQFISPLYFVSFVLTAQFVLINVVVAVLMKHLDDSNKEAQEEAEMDAEIELELAHGALCCMGGLTGGAGGAAGGEGQMRIEEGEQQGGEGSCEAAPHSPGDNKANSANQLYSPVQIHMADLERASLRSERVSDRSSSPAHPDDLIQDEQKLNEMEKNPDEAVGGKEATRVQDGGHRRLRKPYTPNCHSIGGTSSSSSSRNAGGTRGDSSTVFQLPAEFFHPAAALPAPPRTHLGHKPRGLRLTSPASWGSLRSPGANIELLTAQYASHSVSSLATGSSEGSLQTTIEEGLSFSVSSSQEPNRRLSTETLRPTTDPHADSGGQRSHQNSTDPLHGSNKPGNSKQLSETLSSLSLTSLLSPSSLVPPLVKKSNSTGSFSRSEEEKKSNREKKGSEEVQLVNLLVTGKKQRGSSEFQEESTSQVRVAGSRKNR
ncbi:Voltage-dependent T-type calcium channel subunit alpha-1I [Bagarius yarrelli]|uniref:Voltage-dependent T-type calcium channel subunit alpha-1I n=1 Tax=Bagarius yarrelli TaxID=175774 RepID=A0A556VV99_BAGYA|nr:Voltage-dependent T-type calcium channel subunit alpha-1I [Bagarius yarrelli]